MSEDNQIAFTSLEAAEQDHPLPEETLFAITKREGDIIFNYLMSRPIFSVDDVRPCIEILQSLKPLEKGITQASLETKFVIKNSDGDVILNYLYKQPYGEVVDMVKMMQGLPIVLE